MGSIVTRLGGQATFLLMGNIFTLVVGLPLQIYLTRTISPSGIGVFSLLEGAMGLAAGFIAFGIAPTLVKFIPMHLERGEYSLVRKLVRKSGLVLLIAGILLYGILLTSMPLLGKYFPVINRYRVETAVMGLLVPLSVLVYFMQQALRGFQEIRFMVLGSSFLQLTVKAVLTVVLLAAGYDLLGYAWAVVLSILFAIFWMGFGLRRKLASMPVGAVNDDDGSPRGWQDYAKVMYTGSLLGMAGSYLDRFLLGFTAGAFPVGILLVVKQLQQMPAIFFQMFMAVASPMFSAAYTRGAQAEIEHIYHVMTDWMVRLSAPLFIFFLVFAEPVLRLYGEGVAESGALPFRIMLASQLLNMALGPVGQLMSLNGLEKSALRIDVWQMPVVTLGYLVLVPLFGLPGVAWTAFISVVFNNAASLLVTRRHCRLRWSDKRYLGWIMPMLLSTVIALALRLAGPGMGPVQLVLYLLVLFAAFHLLGLLQGLHQDDRELLRYLLASLGVGRKGLS